MDVEEDDISGEEAMFCALSTSPLNCRWVQPGSRGRLEACEYAVCERQKDVVRVVSDAECKFCPFWQAPQRHETRQSELTDLLIA
jgi:hypothetical protein